MRKLGEIKGLANYIGRAAMALTDEELAALESDIDKRNVPGAEPGDPGDMSKESKYYNALLLYRAQLLKIKKENKT